MSEEGREGDGGGRELEGVADINGLENLLSQCYSNHLCHKVLYEDERLSNSVRNFNREGERQGKKFLKNLFLALVTLRVMFIA